MNIYKEILLEHYRQPRNRGELAHADFSSGMHNPSCGDSVSFQGLVVQKHLVKLMFTGQGCVISQAAASMLSELAEQKKIDEVMALDASAIGTMIGMELGPTRLKCALLPLEALQKGLLGLNKEKGAESAGSCKGNEGSSRTSK
ncbi:MAG TPA: iron-sulfur cluster assembly scaffold protein [Candidatus Babeliales bacterium]|nr:iron-sulfur cluster assembly scaffold protein [Candidatus Babeliales bacterium]